MNNKKFETIITSQKNGILSSVREIFKYKFLLFMLVKRDFVVFYKQTILGPLWYIIQPLINTIVFTVVFGNIAKISTDGIPPFLFYMSGNIIWNYFAICVVNSSNTFTNNINIFNKVYFPRLIVPISVAIISILQFIIQLIFFSFFYIYYLYLGMTIDLNMYIFFIPVLLLFIAITSLGIGALLSSLTVKYKDLVFLINFGIQLWMFATPIIYPISLIPDKYKLLYSINPMSSVVEIFRYTLFSENLIEFNYIAVSFISGIIITLIGLKMFISVEKNFVDTV